MKSPAAILIKLPEVFSAKEARKLQRELKHKISQAAAGVVIDLSRVKRIDLSGLEALLSCMEAVARQDGALRLGGVSPEALTVLELARMDHLFSKFPSFSFDVPSIAMFPEPEPATAEAQASVEVPVAA